MRKISERLEYFVGTYEKKKEFEGEKMGQEIFESEFSFSTFLITYKIYQFAQFPHFF